MSVLNFRRITPSTKKADKEDYKFLILLFGSFIFFLFIVFGIIYLISLIKH